MPKLTVNGWLTEEALMDRAPFETNGAFRALPGALGTSMGRLPEPWAAQYQRDRERIIYTVMSYATPIAWVLDDGTVVIPDVKYSITTSGHQSTVRSSLDVDRMSFTQKVSIRDRAERERGQIRDRRQEAADRARQRREEGAQESGFAVYQRAAAEASRGWMQTGFPDPDMTPYAGEYGFRQTASDYDQLINEVGELSKPVR